MVRALLEEQHMDLAHLPLVEIGEGWDNKLFRLGGDLVVRLPRRAASAALIDATDLSVIWMLPSSARSIFRASTRGQFNAIDDHTWMRARGWALALGLAYLASSRDDEAMGALGRATIDAALNDPAE